MTDRLRGHAHVWRDVAHLAADRLADLVREDKIDILIDLTMHMAETGWPSSPASPRRFK